MGTDILAEARPIVFGGYHVICLVDTKVAPIMGIGNDVLSVVYDQPYGIRSSCCKLEYVRMQQFRFQVISVYNQCNSYHRQCSSTLKIMAVS